MEASIRLESPAEVIVLPSSYSSSSFSSTCFTGPTSANNSSLKKQRRNQTNGNITTTTTNTISTSTDATTSNTVHTTKHPDRQYRSGDSSDRVKSPTKDMEMIELITDQIMRMMQQEDRIYCISTTTSSRRSSKLDVVGMNRSALPTTISSPKCTSIRNDYDFSVMEGQSSATTTTSSSSIATSLYIEKSYSESSIDNVRDIASIQPPQDQQPSSVLPHMMYPTIGIDVWNYHYSNHPASHLHYVQHPSQNIRHRQHLLPAPQTSPLLQWHQTTTPPPQPPPPIQSEQHFTFWRQQMYDWSCLVVDTYHIHRECVTLSFNLLDRYISYELSFINDLKRRSKQHPPPPITREDYQLFSMTCLYIAIKLLVGTTTMTTTTTKTTISGKSTGSGTSRSMTNVTKITIQTFVKMSKNYYSKEVIERTECDIVYGLDWYLHAPTSTSYVRLLLQLVSLVFVHPFHKHILDEIERMAYDITEVAIIHSYFCREKAIDISLASIYHALRIQQLYNDCNSSTYSMVSLDRYWTAILQQLPILQHKQDCPNFRHIYVQLAKFYCS